MRTVLGDSSRRLRSISAWALIGILLAQASGCGDRPVAAPLARPTFRGIKLTVGTLGDPAIMTGISALRGEWEASREGELVLREAPIRSLEPAPDVDLLVLPGEKLGDLVDRGLLEVIPNAEVLPSPPPESRDNVDRVDSTPESPADAFQYIDLVPAYREQVTKYGTDRLGLPLGGAGLVLVYRRDAFTSEANREAAKAVGLSLEPPATWAQFDALARFFQGRDWNGDGMPDLGIAAALGPDTEGLANATFLARAVGPGQHRDQFSFLFDADSMAPRLESPPFVEALRALTTWKELGPPDISGFDAAAARAAFRGGRVAMLIDLAERASTWSHGKPIGVAPLPGSNRVFEPGRKTWESASTPNNPSYLPSGGGWLVGVRSGLSESQRSAAIDLARYLASPENTNRLRGERAFPMLPVRGSQMASGLPDPTSAPDVDARQWSDAVGRTLQAARIVPGLRVPEASGYLDDLAKARARALAGKAPEEALRWASRSWDERTERLGRQRQVWHYRRSLNSLATLPQPPGRGK